MHTPVLLQKAIEYLNVKPGGKYIDATVGEGGHLELINRLGGTVLGIDWDAAQAQSLQLKFQNNKDIVIACGNYAHIESIAGEHGFTQVDGVLFDFGLSMKQLFESGKGFSFQHDEDPLDMRLNEELEKKASDIINSSSVSELYEIFAKFAEEFHSISIAEGIVRARIGRRMDRVRDLKKVIDYALKQCTVKHPHPNRQTYARIFQALRIAVNKEFENIKSGLAGSLKVINPEGRIVVISFHSLEDRIVKQFVREKGLHELSKHVIKGDRELSFERSAKMRVIVS